MTRFVRSAHKDDNTKSHNLAEKTLRFVYDSEKWGEEESSEYLLFSTSLHHLVRSSNDATKCSLSIDGGNEALAIIDPGFFFVFLRLKFKLQKRGSGVNGGGS